MGMLNIYIMVIQTEALIKTEEEEEEKEKEEEEARSRGVQTLHKSSLRTPFVNRWQRKV